MNRVARGHPSELDSLLAADFLLVDVVGGDVIDRTAFVATVGSGLLRLSAIRVIERRTRRHGVTFEAASRYVHVLVRGSASEWRLVNAQGTRIADTPSEQAGVW